MTGCPHPYDNTIETKLQARYDNIPMDQISARVCTDCNTIIDIDGRHNVKYIGDEPRGTLPVIPVDGTTLTVGLANTGCTHDRIVKNDNSNIVDINLDKTVLSIEKEEIDLREATS